MSWLNVEGLDRSDKKILAALRIALGWLFIYAGITKVLAASWSAKGFLMGAKTFPAFYAWLASDGVLPVVDFLNEWGLTLIGVSLILGAFVRLSSLLGALMMVMYWFPGLEFPRVDHGYLVDDHVVYALAMLYFAAAKAGRAYGLETRVAKTLRLERWPKLQAWLG